MSEYKLIYFNLPGKAEGIRFIFAAAGQKYEDFRFERDQWPEFKPNMPFGQVPVLQVTENGETATLAQSNAIACYLANKFGLAGKNDLEKARAHMVADQLSDLFAQYSLAAYHEPDEEKKKEKLEKWFDEILPSNYAMLEKLMSAQKTKFLASDEITWADLLFAAHIDRPLGKRDHVLAILENYPALKAVNQAVRAHPNIAKWVETRPKLST